MIVMIFLSVSLLASCMALYLLLRANRRILADVRVAIDEHRAVQKEMEEMLFSKLQKDGLTASDRIVAFLVQLPNVQLRIAKDGSMTLCKREE